MIGAHALTSAANSTSATNSTVLMPFILMPAPPPEFPLFPTRRSSDLHDVDAADADAVARLVALQDLGGQGGRAPGHRLEALVEMDGDADRKSTRLNSSHRCISYAVFCLKKKR